LSANPKNITNNFFSISFSKGIGLFINLVAFALIARYLKIEVFGYFSLLLAIVGIIAKMIDLGIGPIVFREASKGKSSEYLIHTAISIRLILFIIIFICSNIFFYFAHFNSLTIIIFNILLLNIIVSSKLANIRDILTIPYKVILKMQVPSFLNILDAVLFLILVLLMPVFHGQLVYLAAVYIIASIPGFLILIFHLIRHFKFKFKFSLKRYKWLLKESSPLAGFVVFMALFQQIDLFLLKYFDTSYSVGIYSSALRLVSPLNLIPNALVMTVFPIIIREEINRQWLIQGVYKILFFVSIVIASMFSFKSTFFVQLVYGSKYGVADMPTLILFWSQVFIFFNFFSLSLFTAGKNQIWNLYYSILLVALNLIFDIALIPKYSFLGASIAKILTSFGGFIFILFLVSKIYNNWKFIDLKFFMWFALVLASSYFISVFNIYIYLLLVPILILFFTFLTKYFNKRELNYFLKIIK